MDDSQWLCWECRPRMCCCCDPCFAFVERPKTPMAACVTMMPMLGRQRTSMRHLRRRFYGVARRIALVSRRELECLEAAIRSITREKGRCLRTNCSKTWSWHTRRRVFYKIPAWNAWNDSSGCRVCPSKRGQGGQNHCPLRKGLVQAWQFTASQ